MEILPSSLLSYFNVKMHVSQVTLITFVQKRDWPTQGKTIYEAIILMPENAMPPNDENNEIFKEILDGWIQSKHSIGPEMNGGTFEPKGDHAKDITIYRPGARAHVKAARLVVIGALPDWNGKSEMEYQRLSREMYLKYNQHLGDQKCDDFHQWGQQF